MSLRIKQNLQQLNDCDFGCLRLMFGADKENTAKCDDGATVTVQMPDIHGPQNEFCQQVLTLADREIDRRTPGQAFVARLEFGSFSDDALLDRVLVPLHQSRREISKFSDSERLVGLMDALIRETESEADRRGLSGMVKELRMKHVGCRAEVRWPDE